MGELQRSVKSALKSKNAEQVRAEFSKQGYLEQDITAALNAARPEERKKIGLFTIKELFDRIGYGITSPQFINILFLLSGAGLFMIGIVNGLKTILSNVLSSAVHEYQKMRQISSQVISSGGILFGFSFIFLSLGVVLKSPWFFTIALLLSSIGVVTHGDAFQQFVRQQLKKEKMPWFLANMSILGLLFVAAGILISGYVMDFIPLSGRLFSLTILGTAMEFKAYGYLLCFEITAILFILTGYFMSFIKTKDVEEKKVPFLKTYLASLDLTLWKKNRLVLLATIATMLIIIGQVIVNSFYGIFIWQNFRNVAFGGFMNVAVIFVIALLAAMIGPYITRSVQLKIGEGPMLVFGTLLVALLPLTIYANPNLLAIGLSTAIAIIGAALLGTAQGLFMRKILHQQELPKYFASLSLLTIIPIIILVPVLSWLAVTQGIQSAMLVAGLCTALVAAPLYVIIVWKTRKISATDYFIDLPDTRKLTLEQVEKQVS